MATNVFPTRSRVSSPNATRWQALLALVIPRGYVAGLAVASVSTLVSVASAPILHTAPFIMVFPLGVLVVTARFGIGPAVLTAVVGVLAFDYVFVPPAMAFAVPNLRDALTLAVMLAVATVAGVLAERLRRQIQSARRQTDTERLRNALLSALSHDLRTPLSALVGAGNALCDDRLEPGERREFSRMVAEEASRLNRLVANLLDLTRLESGRVSTKLTPQAIDEVIGSALYHLERRLLGRQIRTNVPEAIPFASFDPVLIEQVIINLVENVICHTPAESAVEISAYDDEEEIRLEVADRGPGVPPGDEERVFERLYRGGGVERAEGGIGLGLSICRAIVTAHDGRIWLENREGGGAVVSVTLPIGRHGSSVRASPSRPAASQTASP